MEHATESRQRHGNHNAMYFPDEADSDDLGGGGPLNEFERTRKLSDDRLLPASIHIVPPVEAGGNNSTAPLPRGASYARQRSQVDSVGSPSWMSSRGGGGGRWSTADSSNALSPGHTTQQQLQKQRDEDERHMAEVLLPATTLLNNICAEQAPSPTTNEAGRRSAAKHGGVAARKTGRDGEKMDEDATARLVQQALQKASNNSNFASNLQRQREQNLFYIRKHMSSIAQAKESQLEMKDFERVLRKIEEDATTVRRRWRARRVMLPNGAPGIDASMAGFDEDNAGGGAPKMAASFESSSSDDDDDGEHDAPTSRAAIQRARERAARSWAEMQRQLVENPDIGQTLRKEVAGSHDRLKTCRTWRPPAKHSGRHVASANNNNSNSTTPRGAQALLTANVPAMPPIDISWGSWPQGSARPARGDAVSVSVGGGGGGGGTSTAPSGMMVVDASGKASPEALTTVPSGLLTSTMGTDLYGGKITWRSTGTEDSPSDAQIREILALENEVTTRRSNLHTLTPEQKLKMLLKRGNGRSVYNISEVPYRGARQSVAGSTSSAGSSTTTTTNNNSNKNATTKRLTNLATATTGASASMLDDSMEMAFQRPPPHPTTTTNTNNNTAEGEAEKMAEGEEVAVVDVGGEDELDEKKGGAASTKLPRLPTAKRRVQFHDEAATAPKSEASDRSTSPEREGAGASPNARPHRGFRPPRKGRDPLPAVYGVGDRSSVLLRQQVLDIRRREMQVEESKAIDVKRTCNLLDRLCPMREVLLEEDVLSAYNNTHPRLWGMKYGKRREDEDEEALLLGQGPLGDGRRSFMEDDAKVWGAHQDGELVCAGTKEEEEAETDDDDADSPTDSNLSSLTGPWGSKQLTNNTGTVLKKKKKHFFLNANTVLEKHRAEIFRTATRIDDEQRKEARLRYVDILEEVSKQRVSDATWPRAEVALTHARDIIREHPHEQNFFGFKSMVSSFSLVQLVQWPVQEMLQHLAALFRVSGTQYKDWMASLYQRLSNSHDYEARFRAVDRTIKGKEIPNEAHVRITIHNCRRLPREEMQTKRNNTNMNAGDESAPLALTDRPSSAMAFGGEGGESSVGPNSSSSKAPPGAGDSKTVVPQVMSDRTLDEGTTTDNNNVVAPSHDDGVVVPVELPPPSRGTVDERNSTSHDAASPIWNDPEYSIRIKAERQIITSSAVPAGNGPVGNGTSDGVSGIDEANKASSNTAVAKRSVHFYNQTFKLHLYDAASTIHITLLRDGQPIAGGEFSIDRYGTGRRTQLWLPLTTTGMVQGKRTELRLTIEVSL